jgi:hypothetical protein
MLQKRLKEENEMWETKLKEEREKRHREFDREESLRRAAPDTPSRNSFSATSASPLTISTTWNEV